MSSLNLLHFLSKSRPLFVVFYYSRCSGALTLTEGFSRFRNEYSDIGIDYCLTNFRFRYVQEYDDMVKLAKKVKL